MNWKTVANQWAEEYEKMPPQISGDDMHALALALTGDPSPAGDTPISIEAARGIRADPSIPIPNQDFYKKVLKDGNLDDALDWLISRFG